MHDRMRTIQRAEVEVMLIRQHLGAINRSQRRCIEGEEQGHERGHCHAVAVDMHAEVGGELSSGGDGKSVVGCKEAGGCRWL